MLSKFIRCIIVLGIAIFSVNSLAQNIPLMINYQGKIDHQGTPHTGSGYFKFSLIDHPASPTINYWVSDGSTPSAGAEPSASVMTSMNIGFYSLRLGDTGLSNMTALPASVFDTPTLYLRTWFSTDGISFEQLVPDRQLVSVPYAYHAETAEAIVGTDVIGSNEISDGTIVNADISSAASIDAAKINTTSATNLVSRIIAGAGVSLSPTNGVGDVTISVTGSGAASDITCTNCVESTDITDGTISNIDISATAAIAASKIADGAGSGLDADTVDGLEASAFATASHNHAGGDITTGTVADARIATTLTRDSEVMSIVLAADGASSGLDADALDGVNSTAFARSGANSDITSVSALTSISRATGGALSISTGTAANDDVKINSNQFVVEGDTGEVGIGVADPTAKLSVVTTSGRPLSLDSSTETIIELQGGLNANSAGVEFYNSSGTLNYSLVANPAGSLLEFSSNQAAGRAFQFGTNITSVKLTDSRAQLAVGTSSPDASAILDLSSTSKGVLLPRMTVAQRNLISTPATGLTIYNTDSNQQNVYNGSAWVAVGSSSGDITAVGDCTVGDCLPVDGATTNLGVATQLVFEGTDDLSETVLTATDATADRTITLPDASGTVAVSVTSPLALSAAGDISLGTVAIAKGGTGATTAGAARTALGAAASGSNSDITSTSGLTAITRATGGSFDINLGSVAGDDFVVDAGKLVVEGDTGHVGIGDASPASLLTVGSGDLFQVNASGAITAIAGLSGATGAYDLGGAVFEIPNSTTLPGTCIVGQVYMDTDATSGQRMYLCESANTWVLQGDGGGSTTFAGLSDTPSSFTAGSLLFTSGSAVTQDNAQLFWDDTNNRLGIGKSTPGVTLDVSGSAAISGNLDLGGASASLEIPNSTAPSLTADGQVALEIDADAINIQAGSASAGGIPANTDVALPLIQQKDITLLEPDQMQLLSAAIPFFTVDAFNYPNGITITAIRLATSASSTMTVNVEEWAHPQDSVGAATISSIALVGATEATVTAMTGDGFVAVGSYVFLELATTDVDWMKMTIWYYVND